MSVNKINILIPDNLQLLKDSLFKLSKPYFLFKTLRDVKVDVFEGWRLFGGERLSLINFY